MTREELSAFLAVELTARGWTVADLARQADMTYELVRSVVRGLSSPSVENANEILMAVGYQLRPVPFASQQLPAATDEQLEAVVARAEQLPAQAPA